MVFWKSVTTHYLIVNGQPECILINCSIWAEWVVFIYLGIYAYIRMPACVCVCVCKKKNEAMKLRAQGTYMVGVGVVEMKRKSI